MNVDRLDYSKPPPGIGSARGGLARAWVWHKTEHDPPGMWTGFGDRWPLDMAHCRPKFGVGAATITKLPKVLFRYWRREARTAAWAWYDRRMALARRCGRAQREWEHWPRCLMWTDADCDRIDHWLAHGGDLPEPLRT